MDLPTDYIRNTGFGKNDIPSNVKGTPFLNKNFTPVQLKINNKTINAQMRYDAYRDAFQLKQSNGNVYLNKNSQMGITYLNKDYSLLEYYDDNEIRRIGYLQTMTENDNLKIFKKHIKIFTEGEEAINSYTTDKPAKFEDDVKYFIAIDSKMPKEVKLKRRDIIRFFNDKKVKSYIKDKKLKFRDEDDLYTLAEYLN
ncbi:hypothetical protein GCM10011532_15720 [Christiangramia forsetii]|nr:hypothetical protein GCM10011532_15720 [Christiangramia forsetii]